MTRLDDGIPQRLDRLERQHRVLRRLILLGFGFLGVVVIILAQRIDAIAATRPAGPASHPNRAHGQGATEPTPGSLSRPARTPAPRPTHVSRGTPRPALTTRGTPRPYVPGQASGSLLPEPWQSLAECESSGHWNYGAPGAYTDGDGYEGGLNFASTTWMSFAPAGYPKHAYDATPAQQIAVARRVLAVQGWGAWPACSRIVGLR